ncbi:EexN family lipoprotein [Paraburkholderia humisilvae]|nr:EexN family lipoprotein [Paraburkholderia humisilvae]
MTAALLCACNQREEAHTRSWYRDHAAEREVMLTQCRDDAEKALMQECMNASTADADIFYGGKDYNQSHGDQANGPDLSDR